MGQPASRDSLTWMAGETVSNLAVIAVDPLAARQNGRGTGQPLPKIVGFSEQLFVFAMTRLAGGFALIVGTAVHEEKARH